MGTIAKSVSARPYSKTIPILRGWNSNCAHGQKKKMLERIKEMRDSGFISSGLADSFRTECRKEFLIFLGIEHLVNRKRKSDASSVAGSSIDPISGSVDDSHALDQHAGESSVLTDFNAPPAPVAAEGPTSSPSATADSMLYSSKFVLLFVLTLLFVRILYGYAR